MRKSLKQFVERELDIIKNYTVPTWINPTVDPASCIVHPADALCVALSNAAYSGRASLIRMPGGLLIESEGVTMLALHQRDEIYITVDGDPLYTSTPNGWISHQ